ncbi:MAG TPA: AraC family transcriptional regulator [Candidatus Eisenbergiella merdipullorum]|uniref:AraC family transcriptional regulator n=1 Tax=Candidatus Eisenbergiella merdipullorum TaxID=2838553 RepID=A0A9D2I8Q9_9FIRM|nr:AraC family transcriptional regulator [Candidatus Eisenbergiella merdipullorum]
MPIYFSSTLCREPFQFDSLGIHWEQEPIHRPKGFPLYHYLQTDRGIGSITVGNDTYLLEEDQGILLAPGVPHEYHGEGNRWLTFFATFSGLLQEGIPLLFQNAPVILAEKEKGRMIRHIIQRAADSFESTPFDLDQRSIYSYQLLLLLADCRKQLKSGSAAVEKYVRPVLKIIQDRYMETLTLEELSGRVYISSQYLSRLFTEYTGCSVYEYLTSYRMIRAKELLLRRPDLSIQVIANDVGYSDASHFILMFRKATGMTPGTFRKMHL